GAWGGSIRADGPERGEKYLWGLHQLGFRVRIYPHPRAVALRDGESKMNANHAFCVLALGSLVACGKTRAFAEASPEGAAGAPVETVAPPATPSVSSPEPAEGAQPVGIRDTPRTDNLGGNASCEADAGTCAAPEAGATESACVPTGERDCTSDLDNDCDGQPDNTLDNVCRCAPGVTEACDAHEGLDGRGPCV